MQYKIFKYTLNIVTVVMTIYAFAVIFDHVRSEENIRLKRKIEAIKESKKKLYEAHPELKKKK